VARHAQHIDWGHKKMCAQKRRRGALGRSLANAVQGLMIRVIDS